MKKKLAAFLTLTLSASLLTGCSTNKTSNTAVPDDKKETTAQSTESTDSDPVSSANAESESVSTEPTAAPEGRYVAQSIPGSTDFTNDGLERMYSVAEYCTDHITEYYTYSPDYTQFYRYRLENDYSWTTETMQWAVNSIPKDIGWLEQIIYGGDGTGYLLYFTKADGNNYLGHVIKQTSDTAGEELDIPFLKQKDERGRYPYPQQLTIDRDGTLYLKEDATLNVIEPQKHKLVHEYSVDQYVGSIFLTDDSVYIVEPIKNTIYQYSKENYSTVNTFTYESASSSSASICVNKENQLCLLLHEGLFTIQEGNDTWEMIYDGSLGILVDPNNFSSVLIPGDKNDYYFSIKNTMYHCFFDANAAAQPAKTLTVYSLFESDQIRRAIALFQTKYPDYRVTFRTATTAKYPREREAQDTKDYISALNTELVADGGSDVLVLDGLPYQSYIEKGILSNLLDYVPTLQHPDDLLPNIVNGCKTEDKIYAMPAYFQFYTLQGPEAAITAADSIHSLAEYIKETNNTSLFSYWYYDAFIQLILNLDADSLYLSEKMISQEDLTQLFDDIRYIQSVTEHGLDYKDLEDNDKADAYYNNLFSSPEILYGNYICDLYSDMVECALAKKRNSKMHTVHNEYLPDTLLGINEASQEKEAAGNFIDILMSKDLQTITYGLMSQTISSSTLEQEQDYYDENVGGGCGNVNFNFPDKDGREQVISMSKEVNKLRPDDSTLTQLYKQVFNDYLSDQNASAEDAAATLYNRLLLYYEE